MSSFNLLSVWIDSQYVKQLRLDAELTQAELGNIVGLGQHKISEFENFDPTHVLRVRHLKILAAFAGGPKAFLEMFLCESETDDDRTLVCSLWRFLEDPTKAYQDAITDRSARCYLKYPALRAA